MYRLISRRGDRLKNRLGPAHRLETFNSIAVGGGSVAEILLRSCGNCGRLRDSRSDGSRSAGDRPSYSRITKRLHNQITVRPRGRPWSAAADARLRGGPCGQTTGYC